MKNIDAKELEMWVDTRRPIDISGSWTGLFLAHRKECNHA